MSNAMRATIIFSHATPVYYQSTNCASFAAPPGGPFLDFGVQATQTTFSVNLRCCMSEGKREWGGFEWGRHSLALTFAMLGLLILTLIPLIEGVQGLLEFLVRLLALLPSGGLSHEEFRICVQVSGSFKCFVNL